MSMKFSKITLCFVMMAKSFVKFLYYLLTKLKYMVLYNYIRY